MPIPNPKSAENKSTYVSRCVGEITGEYPADQAVAICISNWDNEKFKSYPWQMCMSDQQKRGYSIKTAERICQYIRNKHQ